MAVSCLQLHRVVSVRCAAASAAQEAVVGTLREELEAAMVIAEQTQAKAQALVRAGLHVVVPRLCTSVQEVDCLSGSCDAMS